MTPRNNARRSCVCSGVVVDGGREGEGLGREERWRGRRVLSWRRKEEECHVNLGALLHLPQCDVANTLGYLTQRLGNYGAVRQPTILSAHVTPTDGLHKLIWGITSSRSREGTVGLSRSRSGGGSALRVAGES